MKLTHFVAALVLLLVTTSVAAKQEKTVLCHVGDAGKIDLIVVANIAAHLDNPSHCWGDLCDYLPGDMDATGYGTEDSNGDGVDDGCEPVGVCPCWDAIDLLSVEAADQTSNSCSGDSDYPHLAIIQNEDGDLFGARIHYDTTVDPWVPYYGTCGSQMPPEEPILMEGIDLEPARECIEQIAARCAAIGDSIYP